MKSTIVPILFMSIIPVILSGECDVSSIESWPMFRGQGSSQATTQNLPKSWSPDSSAWVADLGGVGQSSPVGWNNRVLVTAVKGQNKESLLVSCFQLNDGKELWTYEQASTTRSEVSDYSSWAAPTPALDAQHVYAFFEDGDLLALNHDGALVWHTDLREEFGPFEGNHGLGTSPTLTKKGVVIALDHEGQSFIISLDKKTGHLQWKTERDSSSAWASPTVISTGNEETIVISASRTVIAYDASTGKQLWEYSGIIGNNVPSITISGEWIAIASNRKGHCRVLRLKNKQVEQVWKSKEASSSFGSPLIYEGRVYFINKAGIVFCHDLETGELLFDHRLPSSTWASPLAADNHIWFFTQDGQTVIMKPKDTPEVTSESHIDIESKDRVYGYAVLDGHIVFRSKSRLVCVNH